MLDISLEENLKTSWKTGNHDQQKVYREGIKSEDVSRGLGGRPLQGRAQARSARKSVGWGWIWYLASPRH